MATTEKKVGENDPKTNANGQTPVSNPGLYTQSENMTPWESFYNHQVNTSGAERSFGSMTEYSQSLRSWMWQYHAWNAMTFFHMTYPMMSINSQLTSQTITPNQDSSSDSQQRPRAENEPQHTGPAGQGVGGAGDARGEDAGEDYVIPPIWKRVAAEFIDFFLLFLFKLGVTIFTVEYIGIIELENMDLEMLMTSDLDYNAALSMTSELIAMEVINRIFICIFETFCLRRGVGGMVGGTTPGKRIMGLKVVSCDELIELPDGKVRVFPARDIGFWSALVRSVIKNFSLAFFFPVCFTVFFFQQNRAAYDIISNSIVVECHPHELVQPRR